MNYKVLEDCIAVNHASIAATVSCVLLVSWKVRRNSRLQSIHTSQTDSRDLNNHTNIKTIKRNIPEKKAEHQAVARDFDRFDLDHS